MHESLSLPVGVGLAAAVLEYPHVARVGLAVVSKGADLCRVTVLGLSYLTTTTQSPLPYCIWVQGLQVLYYPYPTPKCRTNQTNSSHRCQLSWVLGLALTLNPRASMSGLVTGLNHTYQANSVRFHS